ncbi:M48 family metallopeptidase [Alcanivorax sp. MD8A]|uniref:M48 family metallopeptidase n=1 Tax=Alcanivorax sp. MD8A TaxID=1177157 RepID=UPI000C99B04E|nr:M48 family metallopeptidase [Alcanivorax sp. MD8A]MED5430829.1 M48 family metallopeptidase [Pseudomonadota bacterium]
MQRPWLLLLSLLVLSGCDNTPTGREQLALVPDTLMADFGRQAFVQMQQQLPASQNDNANSQVQCVAEYLISRIPARFPDSPLPDSWEIVVFADATPNAFALPGGKIGVNEGLLQVANNDAQLAAVIGHEIAHVLARHGNERLTQELGIKAVLFLIGLFSEGDADTENILQALGVGAWLGIALPFSRAHEEEADVMGLELMASAGFDPRQSTQLWRNMAAASGAQPLEFLSTHPNHESRIEMLGEKMDAALRLYQQSSPVSCNQ